MNDFYTVLNETYKLKGEEKFVLMAALNALVGRNYPIFKNVMQKSGKILEVNGNGERILDFCHSANMVVYLISLNIYTKYIGFLFLGEPWQN